MNWTEFLKARVADVYGATEGLIDLVDDENLDWRPETGHNWMTMGQLLEHLHTACGFCMQGFVTGEWKAPDGTDFADMPEEEMLPPAEKMRAVKSVDEARQALAKDRALSVAMIEKAGEKDLAEKQVTAPWNPTPMALGMQLDFCTVHLEQHKAQLFYYLKLQGKPVHTGSLYGMG